MHLFLVLCAVSACGVASRLSVRSPLVAAHSTPFFKEKLCTIRGGSIVGTIPSLTRDFIASLSLPTVKIVLQLLLTSLNIVCWIVPLKTKKFSANTNVLGRANAFAGGIFLMLTFGHLLAHSAETLHSIGVDINYAFQFTLVGYLLLFFIEKIAFNTHEIMHEAVDGHDHDHGHQHAQGTISKGSLSSKSAIVLLVAMSIHSLIETMALGIATDKTSATMMASSIGLHQPAESVALLVAFLKTSMSSSSIAKCLGLFSLVGPIGVVLGILVSKIASPFMDAVIVAMTAGTFLYVGATEIANEEFEGLSNQEKWKRFAALLSGMGLIYLVTKATEGWEGHHHHSH